MNREELDRLFREKLGKKKVDFKADSWAAMESLLDRRERQRKRVRWIWFLPLLMTLGLGGYFVANTDLITNQNNSDDQQGAVFNMNSVEKTSPEYIRNPQAWNESEPGNAEKDKAHNKDNTADQKAKDDLTNEADAIGRKTASGAAGNGQTDVVSQPASVSASSRKAKKQSPEISNNRTTENSANDQKANTSKNLANLQKYKTLSSHLPPFEDDPDEAKTLIDSLKNEDINLREPFEIGLAGGGQLMGNNGSAEVTPEPIVGAYLRWNLFNNFYLNTEFLYQYNPSPVYEETVTNRSYSFGFQGEKTTLNLTDAHYVQLPVYLDYEALGNHGITGGLNGSYLITGTGKFRSVQSTSLTAPRSSTTTGRVRPDGLNELRINALIGYRFDYNDQLRIQLRGLFSLNENAKVDDERIKGAGRKTGIQLMLQYQLN